MKEGWKYEKIGKLFKTYAGGTPLKSHNEYYEGGNIPWLMSGEVCQKYITKTECFITKEGLNNSSAKYYPIDTVVVAMYGATAAQVGILKVEATSNQAVCGILPNKDFVPEFIYYWFVHIKEILASQAQGGAQPNLSQIKIKNISIPVPPLPDQQRIVSYLDAEFAKIEALKANAEKQLQAAKDLFQAALKELLTPKEGWKMKTIDSLQTDMYRGSGITREQIRLEGVPCVRYGEIYTTYNYWFEECVSHTDEQIINSKKYFEHGDILFAITGESVEDIGKSIAYLGHNKCLAGGDIIVMKHNQNPKYLAYALSTPDAIAQKGFGKTKLKVVHTNAPSLKAIVLPIPSLSEQQRIAARLDALSANVKALQTNYTETITLCNDLKQALLKKVFEEDG